MTKRLVVTGLPCPGDIWQSWLASSEPNEQRILSLKEVFDHTDTDDLRLMARYVADVILSYQPTSIVCHDFGVPLTLLALMRLEKKGTPVFAKVTLFNGAFRKVDVLKARHPVRAQLISYRSAVKEVEKAGGKVDPSLRPYLPRIRAVYRKIIYYSLTEKIQTWLGLDRFIGFGNGPQLRLPIQIIASSNDPYIPNESIEQLKQDFAPIRTIKIDYGHFPYSRNAREILPYVNEFESSEFSVPAAAH